RAAWRGASTCRPRGRTPRSAPSTRCWASAGHRRHRSFRRGPPDRAPAEPPTRARPGSRRELVRPGPRLRVKRPGRRRRRRAQGRVGQSAYFAPVGHDTDPRWRGPARRIESGHVANRNSRRPCRHRSACADEGDGAATMNFHSLDLNLLVVFDALMRTRSVTLAGEKVGLSQSSTSNALQRLRATFNDPLFVRTAKGMEPTGLALELEAPLRSALDQIRRTVERAQTFDPATTSRVFRVLMSDIAQALHMPSLVAAIRRD